MKNLCYLEILPQNLQLDFERHIQYLEAAQATWKISTNSTDDGLGFCDFPEHIEGIELKQYESWSTYIQGTEQYFPDSLLNMLKLCMEDYQIWIQLHEHEKDRRKFNEEWNEKTLAVFQENVFLVFLKIFARLLGQGRY